MRLELEFYGPLRDRIGHARQSVEIDRAPSSRGDLVARLAQEMDAAGHLSDPRLRLAVNDEILPAGGALDLKDGDRIAFLSPFSGG